MKPSHPLSQRSSTAGSLACTSTAASIGDPGSRGVRRLGEWPSAVVSESDHGSSKASHSCSPITISQSHEHCLFGSCLPSWSSSLCSSSASVVSGSGFTSSHSSPSSSDVEESAGQLTSWQSPALQSGPPLGRYIVHHIVCQCHGRPHLSPC